jgi:hypothetical protein
VRPPARSLSLSRGPGPRQDLTRYFVAIMYDMDLISFVGTLGSAMDGGEPQLVSMPMGRSLFATW